MRSCSWQIQVFMRGCWRGEKRWFFDKELALEQAHAVYKGKKKFRVRRDRGL